mgnify:CR=1 FL=1
MKMCLCLKSPANEPGSQFMITNYPDHLGFPLPLIYVAVTDIQRLEVKALKHTRRISE